MAAPVCGSHRRRPEMLKFSQNYTVRKMKLLRSPESALIETGRGRERERNDDDGERCEAAHFKRLMDQIQKHRKKRIGQCSSISNGIGVVPVTASSRNFMLILPFLALPAEAEPIRGSTKPSVHRASGTGGGGEKEKNLYNFETLSRLSTSLALPALWPHITEGGTLPHNLLLETSSRVLAPSPACLEYAVCPTCCSSGEA